jgi:probable rRNA maturation factor|tara:strand:+ start:3712 stop:4230 length:519 start_codon:yes stop_codon:yes gene_type:complete
MSKIFVEIYDEFKPDVDTNKVKEGIRASLDLGSDFSCNDSISVSIVDRQKIKSLNQEFLNENHITDVLSFPYSSNWALGVNKKKDLQIDNQENYLGDIFICLEKIKMQAIDYKIDINLELNIILAHGVLHLLGFHHFNKMEEEKMIKKTIKIIKHLKLDHIKAKLSLETRNE